MANEKDKKKQATSQKGTTYTLVNDSTYNWNAPTGYGVIHLDPNSGGPWGTYHVYLGSAGPDVERKLSSDGLAPHLQNISTLEFKYPDPWWQPIKEYVAPKWNGLLDKAKIKKQGGWLTKYQFGGEAPQQAQTEDQQLLALVTSAYKEVASGKLGESFMYVALLLQDSQGAAKLDSLRTQIPELEEMLSAIEEVAFQQSAYMKKGGCAKKKKVKKGAKGCVPCKRLMKIGGKLVNVLTDCEGNIISRYQAGGWIIPKGYNGLLTDKLVADKYRTVNTGTATKDAEHYYIADDGSLRRQYAVSNNAGGFDWAYENLNQDLNHEGFNRWLSGTINSDTGERTGGVSDFWSNGVNYSNGAVTFNDETTAKGLLGEEEYNKGAIIGNSVHGVSKSGNTWLGDKVEDLNVTAQDYVQHHGGWQNAMQAEDDILKAKRRAAYEHDRLSRLNMRRQMRALDGTANLTINGESKQFASRADARKAIRQDRRSYMDDAKQTRVTNQAAILNTLAPQRTPVSKAHLTVSTSAPGTQFTTAGTQANGSTDLRPANETLKKNGGWLTKF